MRARHFVDDRLDNHPTLVLQAAERWAPTTT
jgi:hypothetical protein